MFSINRLATTMFQNAPLPPLRNSLARNRKFTSRVINFKSCDV